MLVPSTSNLENIVPKLQESNRMSPPGNHLFKNYCPPRCPLNRPWAHSAQSWNRAMYGSFRRSPLPVQATLAAHGQVHIETTSMKETMMQDIEEILAKASELEFHAAKTSTERAFLRLLKIALRDIIHQRTVDTIAVESFSCPSHLDAVLNTLVDKTRLRAAARKQPAEPMDGIVNTQSKTWWERRMNTSSTHQVQHHKRGNHHRRRPMTIQ